MLNPRLVTSGNLSGSNSALSLPGPISLTGSAYTPGAADSFDVSGLQAYSVQAYLTGNMNGTLSLQQSNNMAGWVSVPGQSASFAGNVNQDVMFNVTYNTAGFSRLLWSGSAGSGSAISISSAGNS